MDEGSSKPPSEPLLKLFQEAWNELRAEKGETDPITTTQIETRDGEKKEVNGFEFWQQMIEDVEKQKDDPDYLYYSPINEDKIEELFTTTVEAQPEDESAFCMDGNYYIPRISNLYLQNLNLGFDQWYIVQDFPPSQKVVKIIRRKRYVSPSSTDDEIMLELIYAMELSEKNQKEKLANKNVKDKLEMVEFETPGTSKTTEKEESNIIELDAFLEPENQINFKDMDNLERIMQEQIRTIERIERDRNRAEQFEKQMQALEKGKMENLTEMENTKETEQMSHRGKFEASCSLDLTSFIEIEDEVPQQKEFGRNYFLDSASCSKDVDEIPKQTEQWSHDLTSTGKEDEVPKETEQISQKGNFESSCTIDLTSFAEIEDEVSKQKEFGRNYFLDSASCSEDVSDIIRKQTEKFFHDLASSTKEENEVSKRKEQMSQKREFEASCSKDLASGSGEEIDVSSKNTIPVQVAPNVCQDSALKDFRPNVATENVNPQDLSIKQKNPNVEVSQPTPVMKTPNYGRAPFFIQQGNFRKSVSPYKFHNPYYGHGHRHLVRNPFSRLPFPCTPPPAHRQPRRLFTPRQTPPPTFMQQQQRFTPRQTPPPAFMQQQHPFTPRQTPPPAFMQQQHPFTRRQTPPPTFTQQQHPVTPEDTSPLVFMQQQHPFRPRQTQPPAFSQSQQLFAPTQIPPMTYMSPDALLQQVWRTQIAALPRISPEALQQELWRAQTGYTPRISAAALMQELWRAHIASLPRLPQEALLQQLYRANMTMSRMRSQLAYLPRPPLAHRQMRPRTIPNSDFPPPAHQTQKQRNRQSFPLLYPSVQPSSQWTPQSKPLTVDNPNTISNYDPQNLQLPHERPRTQTAPNILPNADNLQSVNYVPAHLSNISTTLVSRKRVMQDVTDKNPWECIISIKKKIGQTQVIAQAPLCSVIPLPNDGIVDDKQHDIQSDTCVLIKYPSMNAKPKKSALRRLNVKRNQKRKTVHFSQSVIEKDEARKQIERSKQQGSYMESGNNLLDTVAQLRYIGNEMKELKSNEANFDNEKSIEGKSDIEKSNEANCDNEKSIEGKSDIEKSNEANCDNEKSTEGKSDIEKSNEANSDNEKSNEDKSDIDKSI